MSSERNPQSGDVAEDIDTRAVAWADDVEAHGLALDTSEDDVAEDG